MHRTRGLIVILCAVAAHAAAMRAAGDDHQARAMASLRAALSAEARWTKVHAAEALIGAGERDAVARAFERELDAHGGEPQYRIGIWRVLAQTASGDRDRAAWITRIDAAFLDRSGGDRLHASETLGKLAYRARAEELSAFEDAARGADGPLAANALWVLVNSGRAGAEARLAALLASKDAGTRATAAYAVRFLPRVSPDSWTALAKAARAEPGDNIVRASLVAAAFVHAPAAERAAFGDTLTKYARGSDADMLAEACGAFAAAGGAGELPVLTARLDDPNANVRIAAADALLQIDRRHR